MTNEPTSRQLDALRPLVDGAALMPDQICPRCHTSARSFFDLNGFWPNYCGMCRYSFCGIPAPPLDSYAYKGERVLLPIDSGDYRDDYGVSLEAYEAIYADNKASIKRGQQWRDERDTARRKLRNAKVLLCLAWIVAAVLIVRGWR